MQPHPPKPQQLSVPALVPHSPHAKHSAPATQQATATPPRSRPATFPLTVRAFNALTLPLRAGPTNPLFATDGAHIAAALSRLGQHAAAASATPRAGLLLPRPVLVLAGYHAPWLQARDLASSIRRLSASPLSDVFPIAYPFAGDLAEIVRTVTLAARARWPVSTDVDTTIPVDVVAVSMGGLVARAAALPPAAGEPSRPTLRIARLFTLASPHRGASLARRLHPDPAAHDMVPGSPFLQRLDAVQPAHPYELVPYAVLRDNMVGASNTAPPGMHPLWAPGPRGISHQFVSYHPGILADLALRLLGLPPLATAPSAPPRD